MKTPNIGISEQNLKEIVKLLNTLLADEVALYIKTRNYHWNVTGPQFHDFHKFFESQYEELDEILDDVAERAKSLGGHAVGSLSEYAKATRVKEATAAGLSAQAMIADLIDSHESVVRTLRKDQETCNSSYQDAGTADFLTGLMEQHEKMAWMLRALSEG